MVELLYEPHIIEDPLLPFFFHKSTHLNIEGKFITSNWHDNIEIICCTAGHGEAMLDTAVVPFESGDLITVNPNVLHRFEPADDVVYHCLIIDRSFMITNGIDPDRLRFRERFRDDEVFALFAELAKLFPDETAYARIPKIRSAALSIVITMLDRHLRDASPSIAHSTKVSLERIKRALEYISMNLTSPLRLEDISAYVGVSKYHFSREFKSLTAMTLVEYINSCRCKYAKQLLEEGSPVAEAAEKSGFENMSYFAKTFKKYIGKVPSETKLRQGNK